MYLEEDTWDLDEEDQALIHYNQELYQLSKQVMLKLGQYLNTTLPESETFYLFQYLISSRIENGSIKHQNISNEAEEITRFFLLR